MDFCVFKGSLAYISSPRPARATQWDLSKKGGEGGRRKEGWKEDGKDKGKEGKDKKSIVYIYEIVKQ